MRAKLFTFYLTAVVVLSGRLVSADDATPDELKLRSRKNLQQIALAFHKYHEEYGALPGFANFDAARNPLLSWRVQLLPYLGPEAAALYAEFRLDEPWNSAHNTTLIGRMPSVYSVPLVRPLDAGQTCYLVPRSDLTLFPPNKAGTQWQVAFGEVDQGLPNIVLAVEADRDAAVVWSRPSDLPFSRSAPLAGLGRLRENGFLVSWASGQITFVPNTLAADRPDRDEFLRGLFERVGSRGIAFYLELE